MLLLQLEELKNLPIQQLQHGSDDKDLFNYDKLLDMPEDENEVDLEDNSGDEEYIEENDYENEWEIRMDKGKNNEINCSDDNSKGENRNQN
ncbi:2686_t:CDS:2 [Funneliformis geosporum]|uniref:2686_t:CDS:1 n=1 Tax=Funneliformis geosporum TaxID=1117311 RepID=A0A9W4SCZ1_9GLOM|nr:2686_t:CDS:2 [Funneliformis geosporum]